MNAPLSARRAPVFELLRSDGPAAAPPADLIDFTSLIGALRRGAFQLVMAALLAGLSAFGWATLVATPQFRATAVLVMAPTETATPAALDSVVPGLSGDSVAVNTEVEILKSRELLRRLAEEMRLARDPEFNPALSRQPGLLDGLRDALAARGIGLPEKRPIPPLPATVDALEQRVAVRNIPDSRVFEITVESREAAKAAEIANGLARLYLGDQIRQKQAEAERATDWLTARVADLQVELEAADSRARNFAADMELVDAETLQALAAQLKEIRQRIAARRQDLASSGVSGSRARAQIGPLEAMEAELSDQLARQSQDLVRLGQLELEAEASRVIYEHFLGRLKEASVQRGIQTADSRILSAAEIPVFPASPQPFLAAVLAAFLAAVAAAGRLVAREARAEGFRTAGDLETAAGLRVLGQIPRLPGRKSLTEHIAARPGSFAAESVRQLRTALQLSAPTLPQVVMVTSSVQGEGKSTLAKALGLNIAALGKRVLVIEADIRRRPIRRYFRQEETAGLLSVLEGKTRLKQTIRTDEALGIDVLPGGTAAANAADLLSSGRMEPLLDAARKHYDAVVIDTPPVLAVPDARLLSRVADMVLYVVGWDRTTRSQLSEGLRALETVGAAADGLVLSKIDQRGLRRYGHHGSLATFGRKGYYDG